MDAWRADPENFYVYVVDNAKAGANAMAVRVLHGTVLAAMINHAKPVTTYWPMLHVADYDTAEQIRDPS